MKVGKMDHSMVDRKDETLAGSMYRGKHAKDSQVQEAGFGVSKGKGKGKGGN